MMNRQCKVRLSKWYVPCPAKERERITREVGYTVTHRSSAMCNFVEWRDNQNIIYKRYAGLYFIICADKADNELIDLELIHRFGLLLLVGPPPRLCLLLLTLLVWRKHSLHPRQVLWVGDRARHHLRLYKGQCSSLPTHTHSTTAGNDINT